MAPYNRFRQFEPLALRKTIFYFLAMLHYGTRQWALDAESYAESVAMQNGFFNTYLFLHTFNVEVMMYDDVIHSMLYHEARFLAGEV